jgi:hypothetical protein
MRYVDDLKTLAELEKWAPLWRDTVQNFHMEEELSQIEFPDWEELDKLSVAEAVAEIEDCAERNARILGCAAADMEEWGKVEIARIKARAKVKIAA